MPRFVLILILLIVVVLAGGAVWLSLADIHPPQQAVQIQLPNDRFPN